MDDDWTRRFPELESLEPELRDMLRARSQVIHAPKGTVLFGPGTSPENLLMLLDGTVRVQQLSESGREVVLYRVHAGESCVLTTACLLVHDKYSAEGIAETPVDAAAVPRKVFDELLARSAPFRDFVFAAYSRRMLELFMVIEEIAFQRMDIRLGQKLLELAVPGPDGSQVVNATQAQLAAELGTAREVISRQLSEFQRRGWVEVARGQVRLKAPGAISAALAAA